MLAQLNYKTIFDELSPVGGGGASKENKSRLAIPNNNNQYNFS